jgi:hypothetical protein
MKKLTKSQKLAATKKANSDAILAAQRKPTKAEVQAADEFMARTSKGKRKPVTPQVAAIPGTATLGVALAKANGDVPTATVKASKKAKKAEPKAQDDGPFSPTKESAKAGIDGLNLKKGSARHAVMTLLLKSKTGVTREALEKVAPGQVTQSIRVLRRDGKVAA